MIPSSVGLLDKEEFYTLVFLAFSLNSTAFALVGYFKRNQSTSKQVLPASHFYFTFMAPCCVVKGWIRYWER